MKLKSKFYTDGKLGLRYYEEGRGETLVFLHGGGLEAKAYRENIEFLSGKYHVIAPDIPGFGRSDIPPKDWDFSDLSAYFKKFLASLHINEYSLIGYSYGGGIALNMASEGGKNCKKLLLCNCAGIPKAFSKPAFVFLILKEAAVSIFCIRSFRQLKIFLGIAINFIKNVIFRKHFLQLHSQVLKSLNTKLPDLEKIKAKKKTIWTYKDTFFDPEIAEKTLLRIKSSNLEKIKGTHLWILMDNASFEKIINKWR